MDILSLPKSFKTVEIMQQCKFGFTLEYVKQLCSEWTVVKDFAYILHDKDTKQDGTPKEEHIHLMVRFNGAVPTSAILNKLQGVCEVQHLQKMHSWNSAIAYLTHSNDLTKHQYAENEVVSNFEWQVDRDKALATKGRIDTIIKGIDEGVIKEYNYTEHITMNEYTKYKRQIDSAFKYRVDKLEGANRMMECIYITGASGTGKTTYAKNICEENNHSYFVSSGSNDPFDNYKGQQVIILDDMRPDATNLSDLLKLLDNNTASSVKSRYKNKVLECEKIIITSTLSMEEFFNGLKNIDKESIVQLKRRCGMVLKFFDEEYEMYLYNKKLKYHEFVMRLPNPYAHYAVEEMTMEDKIAKVKAILGNAAQGLDNFSRNLECYVDVSKLEQIGIDEDLDI